MALLSLDSVHLSFHRGDNDVRVLRDVSFDLDRGEVMAVHGARGSGKTTLLRVAAGYERIGSGQVTFAGSDLARLTARKRATLYSEGIAWIDQAGPRSDELTTTEYVSLPVRNARPREARRRAAEALRRVDAADCGERRWAELTDSEQIRVAIAQGLVRAPQMLVIDDASLGLGVTERDSVIGLLRAAAVDGGLAVLMAVSDLTHALGGCRVRSLSRGRLLGGSDEEFSPGAKILGFPVGRSTPD
jgi:ABC-type lipoprotein export system ATPase subunit